MKTRAILLGLMAGLCCWAGAMAEDVVLPEHHLQVTLPPGWLPLAGQNPSILVRAEAEAGKLRFILTVSHVGAGGATAADFSAKVKQPAFQDETKKALVERKFTKILRSEVIKLAGSDAFLCEAVREDLPHSFLQLQWAHDGEIYCLVFASLSKPFKEVPEVQAIINSVKVLPGK